LATLPSEVYCCGNDPMTIHRPIVGWGLIAQGPFSFCLPKKKMGKKKKGTEIEPPVESRRPHRLTISTLREKVDLQVKCNWVEIETHGFSRPSHTAIDFRGRGHFFLQRTSRAPSCRNHRQVHEAASSVWLISVQAPKIQAVSTHFLAPKFWQAGGCITTGVMISEVLFGYFLFKEKVTDATTLKQVASLLHELPVPMAENQVSFGTNTSQ
jgi:hypothetical protein